MSAPEKTERDRILSLEELTAHQALTIEELSAEVARQNEIVRAMEVRLHRIAERLGALEADVASAAENRRPPHW